MHQTLSSVPHKAYVKKNQQGGLCDFFFFNQWNSVHSKFHSSSLAASLTPADDMDTNLLQGIVGFKTL